MPDTHRDEIEKLEALYASNPAGRVFTHLAEAYRKAGELDRAREILDGGLSRHPDYPSAYVVLGRIQLDCGETEAAATAFRRVLELDRHNLVALRSLGDLAVEAGRFEEARHYFGELILIDPADLETAERLETLPDEPAFADIPPEPQADASVTADGEAGDAESEPPAGIALETEAVEAAPDESRSVTEPAATWLESAGEIAPESTTGADEPEEAVVPAPDSPPREPPPLEAWVETLSAFDADAELPDLPPLEPAPPMAWPDAASPPADTKPATEPEPAADTEPATEPEPAAEASETDDEAPDLEFGPVAGASETDVPAPPAYEPEPVAETDAEPFEVGPGPDLGWEAVDLEAEPLAAEPEARDEWLEAPTDATGEEAEPAGPEPEPLEAAAEPWIEPPAEPEPDVEAERAVEAETYLATPAAEPTAEAEPPIEVAVEAEPGLEPEAELEIESEVVEEPAALVSDAILEPDDDERAPQAGMGPEPEEDVAGEPTVAPEDLASAWWGDPEIHGSVPEPVEWVSQEDWEQIAASGTWSGTGEADEVVEAVPPVDPEWGSDRDEDADEVATETLAEVYAAQGFKSEAAEIYRKLLRRRPDDERLLARLAALEKEPGDEAVEAAGIDGTTAGPPASDLLLEEGESWPGGEEQAEAGPTPYAWMESGAPAEHEEGGTIGERLRAILGWQPETGPEALVAEPEPEPTLLLDDVAPEPPLPDFPVFGHAERGGAAPAPRDTESEEDLEMFRSWLKSLRK